MATIGATLIPAPALVWLWKLPVAGSMLIERAVVARDDQAVAGEDRAEIVDLTLLRLGMLELGQLVDPPDVAVLAVDAQQLGIVGDGEDPVARDPRGRDAGDVELPLALAGGELERDHAPALADGDHLAAVDHRVGIDVGQ